MQVVITLLFAGYEATSTQIPSFTRFLLERRGWWAELVTHPEKIPVAVEKLLRFVPLMAGAGTMPRYALHGGRRDCHRRGRAGDRVAGRVQQGHRGLREPR